MKQVLSKRYLFYPSFSPMFEYMHVWTGIASLICIFCIQYVNKHLCFHIKDVSTPIKTSLNGNQLQLVLDHSVNFTQNHATYNCSPVATFVTPVQLPVFFQSFDWTFKHPFKLSLGLRSNKLSPICSPSPQSFVCGG